MSSLGQWRCRICGVDRHHRVIVLRKTGVVDFFEAIGKRSG
jgi:hypothetical protein